MTQGFGPSTILTAFESGESVMDVKPQNWRAGKNDGAKLFVERQMKWRAGLRAFDQNKLKGFATSNYQLLLETMRLWNMRMSPPPQAGPSAVYMISLLNDLVAWKFKGTRVNTRPWPEFVLDQRTSRLWSCSQTKEPVVIVDTLPDESGRVHEPVRMLRWPTQLTDWEIIKLIEEVEASMKPWHELSDEHNGVQIPCVHATWEPNMDWVLDLANGDWFIAFAKQLIEFGMNENGFAQHEEFQAVAMKFVMGGPYPLSPGGENFLFWRRSDTLPVSGFQFGKDVFRDPGDLNSIVA